jgi:hypothetical protein
VDTVAEADPFLWQVTPPSLVSGGAGVVALKLVVPPGYVVYRDEVEVEVTDAAGLQFGVPDLPAGVLRSNPVDGSDLRVLYDRDVWIDLPVAAPPDTEGLFRVVMTVRHQGCRAGLCFSPVTTAREVIVRVRSDATVGAPR